jgi:hypothetical protein
MGGLDKPMIPVTVKYVVIDRETSEGYWLVGDFRTPHLKVAASELVQHVAWGHSEAMGYLLEVRINAIGD